MSFWSEKGIEIAQWLGYRWTQPKGHLAKYADPYWARNGKAENPAKYDTNEGAGVLLAELGKKDLGYLLDYCTSRKKYQLSIWYSGPNDSSLNSNWCDTLHEAVVDAILQIARKENEESKES
jgi:hypothetical protein